VTVSFLCGVVFAAGLALAGMTSPAKVIGFLDVGGAWDPSLALVMLGAIGVYLPVHRLVRRRARPLLAPQFYLPPEQPIDGRLLAGAAVFGVGWGLSGYCPGPALASLAHGALPLWFAGGMVGAMLVYEIVRRAAARARPDLAARAPVGPIDCG